MIIAKVTPISEDTWRVFFEGPTGVKFAPVTVYKIEDAHRRLYFNTRDYIHAKMIHWLVQRSVALSKHKDYHKLAVQQSLYDVLNKYKNHSYWRLCEAIYELSDKIKLISPPEQSSQRKYYDTVIRPILDFCEPKRNLNG